MGATYALSEIGENSGGTSAEGAPINVADAKAISEYTQTMGLSMTSGANANAAGLTHGCSWESSISDSKENVSTACCC